MSFRVYLLILSMLVLIACRKEEQGMAPIFEPQTPIGFPEMVYPQDNPYSYESWFLGKQLFFDKRLSRNNDLSCATCHQPDKAFTDNLQFSFGDNNAVGTVNAPTLTNTGYQPYFNFSGGVISLETQILVPIQEHNEFNTNILDIIAKLSTDLTYEQLSYKAYNRPFDAFVLTRALANFQRSLISGNSRYDQHFLQNKNTLNESELRGHEIFFGDVAKCSQCHSGFNFTSYVFENNGLYEEYDNMGRMLITFQESDRAKFKIPTLRNIALTAPYMHDGSFTNLEQVVEHYNNGGANHPNKSTRIQPLNLTNDQKQDLVNFLKTLTDDSFVQNPFFKQ